MLDPDFPTPEDDANNTSRGMRNGIIFGAALWLVMGFACSVMAQSANSGAQSASGANAGASSGSTAIVVFPASTGPSAQQAGDVARAQGYRGQAGLTRNEQGVEYSGGTNNVTRSIIQGGTSDTYRATIRNTPDAYAPNVSGGTNSCLVGLSGAGSVAGFGFGLGGNWSDPDCERRQLAALAHNTGQQAVAQEVLCGSRDYREARQRLGQPCQVDRPQQVAATQPVMIANPVPGPVEVIGGGAAPMRSQARPDWCLTASPAERRQYRSTCG